jgi:hypothetical protein
MSRRGQLLGAWMACRVVCACSAGSRELCCWLSALSLGQQAAVARGVNDLRIEAITVAPPGR